MHNNLVIDDEADSFSFECVMDTCITRSMTLENGSANNNKSHWNPKKMMASRMRHTSRIHVIFELEWQSSMNHSASQEQ